MEADSESSCSEGFPTHLAGLCHGFDEDNGTFEGFGSMSQVAPHTESPVGTVRRMVEMVQMVGPVSSLFMDLGCGRGAVINHVAKYLPNCHCLGIDISAPELELARTASAVAGVENLVHFCQVHDATSFNLEPHLEQWDPWATAINVAARIPALVIYIYLVPRQIESAALRAVILPFLESGAKVVVLHFFPQDEPPNDWPYLCLEDRTFGLRLYWRGEDNKYAGEQTSRQSGQHDEKVITEQ